MLRLLLLLSLSGVLSACTLSGKNGLDEPSLDASKQNMALIFQSGEKFGSFLTDSEKRQIKEIEEKTLNFGKPSQVFEWSSKSGVSGVVIAYQLFRVGTEQCRKFKHSVTNSKTNETAEATACLPSSGKWQLVR